MNNNTQDKLNESIESTMLNMHHLNIVHIYDNRYIGGIEVPFSGIEVPFRDIYIQYYEALRPYRSGLEPLYRK